MGRVWPLQMPPAPKAVLISLADQANDDGECWPAVGTIALRTCLHERTVRKCLVWLQDRGALRIRTMARQCGRTRVNVYIITPGGYSAPEQANAAPADERPDPAPAAAARLDQAPNSGPEPPATPWPTDTLSHGHPVPRPATPWPTATQTINEPIPIPPIPPEGASPGGEGGGARAAKRPGRPAQPPTELATWLRACAERGERPIPPDDPVYAYAEAVGLPDEFIALCWAEFKRKRLASRKRQRDWRGTFRNAVEGNWFRLWYADGLGRMVLTTQGVQARRLREAEQREPVLREAGREAA